VVHITGIDPTRLGQLAQHLGEFVGLESAVAGDRVTVTADLAARPFYKILRLVSSGVVDEAAVKELEQHLSLFPELNPHVFSLDDLKANFLAFFPRDKPFGVRLYKLILPFFHVRHREIGEVIRFFAPSLAELAEVKDLWFVCQDPLVSKRRAMMRILHGIKYFPDLATVPVREYGGFQSLEQLQTTGSIGNSRELNFLFSLFTPTILGFAFEQMGGTFAFTFDGPRSYATEFPPRLQDLMRPSLFQEDVPFEKGGALANRTWRFPRGSTQRLIEDFVVQMSVLDSALLNPLHFGDERNELDVRRWHLTNLTTSRLFIDATLAQTEHLNHYYRKLMTFRNFDSLAQILAEHPTIKNRPEGQVRSEPEIFKQLFSQETATLKFGTELEKYPAPFGNLLRNWNHKCVTELYAKTLEGIFVPGTRAGGNVTVSGNAIPEQEYVREFLREVRNTQHGYNIRRFDVLRPHSGSVSDALGELAKFPVLAVLRNPALILDAGLLR
jgi:hypothetical protein